MPSLITENTKILGERAIRCLEQSANNRVIIAIAGIPGSGKTTIAQAVSDYINSCLTPVRHLQSVVVGMDGFHFPRKKLMEMPDPEFALARRGAPFTFDAQAVVDFVRRLRESCLLPYESPTILSAPSFDHKLKDPVENGVLIEPNANIVFVEGLYLLLNEQPWCAISDLVDERWFIEIDPKIARERVAKRHLEAGIELSVPAAYSRADNNDALNGQLILSNKILSIDVSCK